MLYSRGNNFTANKNQSIAISHPPAPLMILAGAGTGKTTTLFYRILYKIENEKVDPASILAITYTEKAAFELQAKIHKELGHKSSEIAICTFHSFCYSIVKSFADDSQDAPKLLEEGDAVYLLLNHFDSFQPFESSEFPFDPTKAVTESFLPFFNRIRDELINPDNYQNPSEEENTPEDLRAQLNDLRRIYPRYQELKKEKNFVDYGDMILQAYDMINQDPSLRKTLQEKYRHIIVDEFQDNNHALNEIMGLIAEEHGSITVVGDDDQVIYSFRGASPYNIHDFQKRYSHFPNYKEISLIENYRSHQPILDAANNLIATNKDRIDKTLISGKSRSGPKPEIWRGIKTDQLQFMIDTISQWINEGQYTYQDIAILCRTKNQVKDVVSSLLTAHIPTLAYLTEFFKIPIIKDLIAWCDICSDNQYQNTALYRILRNTLSDKDAIDIFQQYSKRDYTNRIELIRNDIRSFSSHVRQPITQLLRLIDVLQQEATKKRADEVIEIICEKIELFKPYVNRYEYQDQLAIQNAGKFILKAQSFVNTHTETRSLYSFMQYIHTLQQSGNIKTAYPEMPSRPAVLVQTIHGVKGAEFPVVFIPFNQTGSFPLNFKTSSIVDRPPDEWLDYSKESELTAKEHHYQEERRIFYVAMTRAKEQLYILAPQKRTSTFIKKDLDLNLVKEETMPQREETKNSVEYQELKNKYDIRLQEAVAIGQYDTAHTLIRCLERIGSLESTEQVQWGTEPWEIALKEEIAGNYVPSVNDQLFLSASSIETYISCPLKYRLTHVDRIPGSQNQPQLVFGNIIHQVLDQFHKDPSLTTEDDLLSLLDTFWMSDWFTGSQSCEKKYYKEGQNSLHRYWDFLTQNPPVIIGTEKEFQFTIEDITIRGKIDRIDQGKSGLQVLDYKTSKKPQPAKKSLQLAIYSLYLSLTSEEDLQGLPEWAGLYFLREPEDPLKVHTFTEEELSNTQNDIIEVASKIRQKEFAPCKGFHCSWCDYKDLLCPEWEEK